MKKLLGLLFFFLLQLVFAQYVTLSKAVKTSDNQDKFLYQVNPNDNDSEYLGEIEVEGFSPNNPEVFSQVYKKAKTIGANSFSLKKIDTIDGEESSFNPAHFFLNLYYTTDLPKEDNTVYIISSSNKPLKIKIDNKPVILSPRSFHKIKLQSGFDHSLVSGGFLGSKIKMAYKQGQPVQYFQILSGGIRADQSGVGGLNLKSGDIIMLEKSYAQFLTTIYRANN